MYLHCHSGFSLRYGTVMPDDLVIKAKEKGTACLLLADINNTSAHFDFVRACEEAGIHALLGIEFRAEDYRPLYIGIAQNLAGLAELNRFLSEHSLTQTPLPDEPPSFEHVVIVYRMGWIAPRQLKENERVGVASHEVNKLYVSPWKDQKEKLLAWNTVSFLEKEDFYTHQLLRAIDQNVLLSRLDTRYIAHESEYLPAEKPLSETYGLYPEILEQTKALFDGCSCPIDTTSAKSRKTFTGNGQDDGKLLEKLAFEGFAYRYGERNQEAMARLKKELGVIAEEGFLTYFLIAHDILRYAHSRGYHHVGRGSGANSIVAYCLKITDVDPMELDLYFERFINRHRSSPPDFDIDFSWDQRDDVIDYIFKRYGREHVGLIATYSTFGQASVIRELGKVYGLPAQDIEQMANEPKLKEKHHALGPEIFLQGSKIMNLPSHLGIHAGGMLITERPIFEYTALQMMPKGFPIVQFDMHVAEENNFFKFDILSQRGLGHLKDSVDIILKNRQVRIDIHQVEKFKKDEEVRKKLMAADTIGCFYIESPAMRGLLTKLRCGDYKSLVAASSIIRPGVAKSGMMREYIYRFQNPDNYEYLHPIFRKMLGETFGIMVYQEDVIKIAHHFGGLELEEADILRRIMSGKGRSRKREGEIRLKFFANCQEKGYSSELATEVWRQIESFSGFSFCKAHSASFAVESYQSLFLKTYFPLEFMVGVINNFGGFYRTEIYVHEARRCGADIQAPCVNHSDYLTNIQGKIIYLGFVHLKDLNEKVAKDVVQERMRNGPYTSLENFVRRTGIGKEQLCILIRIGALRFTGTSKQELLWAKNQFVAIPKESLANAELFMETGSPAVLPPLETDEMEEVYEQMELLGFPLVPPFELLKTSFRSAVKTHNMGEYLGQKVRMLGYYVAKKDTRTSKGQYMNFGTWIDEEGRFFDTTHFPNSLANYPFQGNGCYLLLGKVVEDFGFPSLEVEKMARLEWRELKGR